MRIILFLLALGAGLSTPAAAEIDYVGYWEGPLDAGGVTLRIGFEIARAESGELTVALDSIDQGARGIPAEWVPAQGGVEITVPAVGGRYTGEPSADGSEIVGTWEQGPARLPLTVARKAEKTVVVRPQEPVGELPYRAEDLRFPNDEADFELAGTLTLPETDCPAPAVVLVSGSGPQDRNEALMGHKPFLVLADHLTRAGIAVLRYDDRGVAESGGDFGSATTQDFVTDALAAVRYLGKRPEVRSDAIGIIGHSEGGLIAPIAANRSDDVDFVVLLAGTSVSGHAVILEQSTAMLRATGVDEALITKNGRWTERLLDAVVAADPSLDQEALVAQLGSVTDSAFADFSEAERTQLNLTPETMAGNVQRMASPWFRYFLGFDPAPGLRQLSVPTLALFGELDLQVLPAQHEPVMRGAFEANGRDNYEIVTFPKLNHLFQTATTGAVAEYATIEETMAPVALETMSRWILETTGQ